MQGERKTVPAAQRYQSGLVIALLAARPLRIRNFQAITIGTSLRWDGRRYWLTFNAEDTKTGGAIDEPMPDDLIPYLEAFLRSWRPVLVAASHQVRRATPRIAAYGSTLRWADEGEHASRADQALHETQFGTAVWPHLFRDCLLTSVAMDQPDLMSDQRHTAWPRRLRYRPEALQPGPHAGCQPAVRRGHLRAAADLRSRAGYKGAVTVSWSDISEIVVTTARTT